MIRIFVLIASVMLALPCLADAAPVASVSAERSADGLPQRLVLAIDGIPHELVADLQRQGHLAGFRPAARMVASFPSLSAVSFAAIGGAQPPEGYQVMRFDVETNRVVGNTIGALSSRSHMNLPADSSPHSSVHRMIGYMAPSTMARRDLQRIGRELLASDKATFVAYLGQSDVILHVNGRDSATRFLLELDRFLVDLQARVQVRTGRGLMIDLISDHGSTMTKGRNVALRRQLGVCGFRRSDRIDGPRDVAYSLAGIIGSVAINTHPTQVEAVARCLRQTDGVDLVAFDQGAAFVTVLSADGGEARISPAADSADGYDYQTLQGDPLQLVADAAPGLHRLHGDWLFQHTIDSAYPDALRRIWRAFHGAVREPTPILVSLRDGHEAGYRSVRALARLRGRGGTHGSLSRSASLGVLTSNWRDVQDVDCWRANEVLFGAQTVAAARRHSDGWLHATNPAIPVQDQAPAVVELPKAHAPSASGSNR